MTPILATQLHELVKSIKAHQAAVDTEACRLRTPEILTSFDKRSSRSWCISVMGDSLVRLRLLLEQNFNFIETIGVVAVSRYLFELSVWLCLFVRDERYGLVYYGQLLETQQKYFTDYLAQLHREVKMLREFERKECEAQRAVIEGAVMSVEFGEKLRSTAQIIDEEAARMFSLYAEQARVNGYGFQSHMIEKTALTQVKGALEALSAEQAYFDANILPGIRDLALAKDGKRRRWEWKRMAERVGLLAEYDFIYAFASKLLHATPASITTDQKNLGPGELIVFLRYIDIKARDMLDLASRYPRGAA